MSSRSIYKRKPVDSLGRKAWTNNEDRLLRAAMVREGLGHWTEISKSMGGRTPDACRKRWEKVLDPSIKKGTWLAEEDALLYALVSRHGPKKWTLIASHIPGRTDKQCRQRWFDNLAGNAPEDAIIKGREILEKRLADSLPQSPAQSPKVPTYDKFHDVTSLYLGTSYDQTQGSHSSFSNNQMERFPQEQSYRRIRFREFSPADSNSSGSDTHVFDNDQVPTYRSVFTCSANNPEYNSTISNFQNYYTQATPSYSTSQNTVCSIPEYSCEVSAASNTQHRIQLPPLQQNYPHMPHSRLPEYPVTEVLPQFSGETTLPSLSTLRISPMHIPLIPQD